MYSESGEDIRCTVRVRVLVIDDEPSVTDALRIILEDQGFEVAVAATGREGIEHARLTKFDVIITDLRLPDANGLDLIVTVREGDMARKVILITSYATDEVIEQALTRGAGSVVLKPFPPSEIIQQINAGRVCCQCNAA
ncbi:MAG: response regulator [Acidobacteria bacterium]|nr:response regulator [Acidobacteriota bacterium]